MEMTFLKADANTAPSGETDMEPPWATEPISWGFGVTVHQPPIISRVGRKKHLSTLRHHPLQAGFAAPVQCS